jgi:hypothetical protein
VQDGVDDDRIVGFLLGKVNISAHEQLIEASTNKYATYKVHKNELRI